MNSGRGELIQRKVSTTLWAEEVSVGEHRSMIVVCGNSKQETRFAITDYWEIVLNVIDLYLMR